MVHRELHVCVFYGILQYWIKWLAIKVLKGKTQKKRTKEKIPKDDTFYKQLLQILNCRLNNKASSIFKSYCLFGSCSVLFSHQLNSKWSVHMTDYSAELALWLFIQQFYLFISFARRINMFSINYLNRLDDAKTVLYNVMCGSNDCSFPSVIPSVGQTYSIFLSSARAISFFFFFFFNINICWVQFFRNNLLFQITEASTSLRVCQDLQDLKCSLGEWNGNQRAAFSIHATL